MQIRNLGASGLRVSAIGLGCNNFGGRLDLEASRTVIHRALDAGITLFDTADIYGERGGSETVLGRVLGARRQEIVLATKFGGAMDDAGRLKGASRGYIIHAVEASLRRLQTDWIDLYQIHFPDPLTPIEETLRALDDLIHAGKVRYIGCSNLPAWQMVEAQWDRPRPAADPIRQRAIRVQPIGAAARSRAAAGDGGLPDGPVAIFSISKWVINREVPRWTKRARRRPAGNLQRIGGAVLNPWQFRAFGPAGGVCPGTRAYAAGAGVWLAAVPAAGSQRDCRRDPAGAGQPKRRGRRLGADGGG